MRFGKAERERYENTAECFACGEPFASPYDSFGRWLGNKGLSTNPSDSGDEEAQSDLKRNKGRVKKEYGAYRRHKNARTKVRDHDHYTGEYRCAMHNECNLQVQDKKQFPVFFHNFSGYDSHLIMKELNAFDDGELHPLMQNEERPISITKRFPTGPTAKKKRWHKTKDGWQKREYDYQPTVSFIFKDSFRFMNQSLSALAKNLPDEAFNPVRAKYGQNSGLLLGKQVFPYSSLGLIPIEEFGQDLGHRD